MQDLYPIPTHLTGAAADAAALYRERKYQQAIGLCDKELRALDKQIPAKSTKPPQSAEADSAVYRYYALTNILVNALAMVEDWKAAKEALGRYRVRFPRDPWGFDAGAVVTRRDPQVRDQAAVTRAAELLEGEAERLRQKK